MKTISVFIGSSIRKTVNGEAELNFERGRITSLFSLLNFCFDGEYRFNIIKCEEESAEIRKEGSQAEIDRKVVGSDYCIFMFNTVAGEYTLHELDMAYKKSVADSSTPKISVFFKSDTDTPKDIPEIKNAVSLLENEYHIDYGVFCDADTLLYDILYSLLDYLEEESEIGISEGNIYIGSHKISTELIDPDKLHPEKFI